MLTMLDRETTPNGGYSYLQSETRTRLTAPTLRLTAETVIKHRQANGIAAGSMDEVMLEIEGQICATAPPGTCRDVQGQVVMSGVNLSLAQVMQGTATLLDWFSQGREKVSQEIADQRSQTCASCYANKDPDGCGACAGQGLRELADKIVGGKSTRYDSYLKACAICGCSVRAKLWLPIELIRKHTLDEQRDRFPEHCWVKKEP